MKQHCLTKSSSCVTSTVTGGGTSEFFYGWWCSTFDRASSRRQREPAGTGAGRRASCTRARHTADPRPGRRRLPAGRRCWRSSDKPPSARPRKTPPYTNNSSRRRCCCGTGSVCTTQRHVTWPTSVCRRRLRTVVASLALQSQSPGTSWCPGLGRLLASAAFAAYGPTTWNRLPTALRSPELSLSSFKRQLKTHLFLHGIVYTVVRRCCDCPDLVGWSRV